MFCINCSNFQTRVVNSRPSKKAPVVWRRRECAACGHLFTTDEMPRMTDITIHVDGSRDKDRAFNPGVLLLSVAGAFSHSPEEGAQYAWSLTQTIIAKLFDGTYKQLTTSNIKLVTHQTLEYFDPTAAAQYALSEGMITSLKKRGRPSFGDVHA